MGLGFAPLREPDSRPRHGAHGERRHGVVPAAGHVRHPRDRRHAHRPARSRPHRPGRAAVISTAAAVANAVANAIGVRVRRLPLSPDASCRRSTKNAPEAPCEALCLRQRRRGKRGRRRPRPGRGKFLPLAGGMDLLALMKDYIAQPERLVNVKGLDRTSRGRRTAACGSAPPCR